jgi:hypothetical protein
VLTAEVVLAEIIAMAGVYHTTASKLHEDADEFPLDLGNAFLRFKMNESADSAAFARLFDKREAQHDGRTFCLACIVSRRPRVTRRPLRARNARACRPTRLAPPVSGCT